VTNNTVRIRPTASFVTFPIPASATFVSIDYSPGGLDLHYACRGRHDGPSPATVPNMASLATGELLLHRERQ